MQKNLLNDLKILCVEDEENISKLLKNAIGENFYSFAIAKDGIEGLEKFEKVSPDIIITDIMMPKLDGLEMTKKIKELNDSIPIIILSAFSEKEKLLKAIDLGISKYFIKPFDPEELLEYITVLAQKIDKQRVICLNKYFSFDVNSKNLFEKESLIKLSKREKEFINLLVKSKKDFVSIDTMKTILWEDEVVSDERIRTFIKRLRQKTNKELIVNISGQGYLISKDEL
ncbi:response regulator transcription factor [Halarcobacter bivalviorum]|uniref:Two-component system response regulator n=1 Tax=Halarcobacter bivalviorum TaxID=663364 RepID=A0AB33GLR5_9BACT|nr:response regulator transcription factor [Halarcobacter bivalviorum]AXH12284.1 two-component system response regulator [Halarcobacter bivalviorum]